MKNEIEIRNVIKDFYGIAMGDIENNEYDLADGNIKVAEALRWTLGETEYVDGEFEEMDENNGKEGSTNN